MRTCRIPALPWNWDLASKSSRVSSRPTFNLGRPHDAIGTCMRHYMTHKLTWERSRQFCDVGYVPELQGCV